MSIWDSGSEYKANNRHFWTRRYYGHSEKRRMQAGLRFDFAQPRLLAFFNRWGLARVQGEFPRPLLGLFTSTALSPHAPTADPANNAHYSRFWDKWGASQNFVSSPLLALISPNLLILFTK